VLSLHRKYASLYPPTGAHDVCTFLSLNKLYFFLHGLIDFYEQASSRTSWLIALFGNLVSLTFGDCSLAGGMKEKEITSLCYLSTFAWIFPTISALHFLAFAFLAITFWSKERVITGKEGLMSSGPVTNVTGTLFRMRNTFCCWTVRMNILLAFAHSTASWSSHLNTYEDIPTRLRTFFNQKYMVWPLLWLSA